MTISTELLNAYKFHRATYPSGTPRAVALQAPLALIAAHIDVAAGKARYPHGARHSALGAPFNGGLRWSESPADIGLRFVGYADKLARIDHTGWFTDEFQDSTVRGVVYQLPGSNGAPRYLAGYDNADNGAADKGGPAAIDFSTVWEGLPGERPEEHGVVVDAARAADSLAERMAEKEREYQAASSAGFAWADRGEEIASDRAALRALLAERRQVKAAGAAYPSICAALTDKARALISGIARLREERAELASGNGLGRESVHAFYPSAELRAAFNNGAGSQVLA